MFKDWEQVPEWLKPLVEIAVSRELIHGYPDGTIGVDKPVIRGELIAAIAKLAMQAEETNDYDRRDLMRKIANAVVEVRSSAGIGSGVLVSGGRVLTNAHVVGKDSEVQVRWTSPLATDEVSGMFDRRYPVVKKNEAFDLAMIHAPELAGVTGYVEFAEDWAQTDFKALTRQFFGVTLYTQGSPVALGGALSRGYFSGIHFFGSFYLTFSGSINPGNSGGGIFDTAGRLVSLAVAKPNNPLVDGIGFGVLPLAIHKFLFE